MTAPRYIVHAFARDFHKGDSQIIALGDDGTIWKLVAGDSRWKSIPALPDKEYDEEDSVEYSHPYALGTK